LADLRITVHHTGVMLIPYLLLSYCLVSVGVGIIITVLLYWKHSCFPSGPVSTGLGDHWLQFQVMFAQSWLTQPGHSFGVGKMSTGKSWRVNSHSMH